MSDEPSVLDFVKSLLTPWRGKPLPIPKIERQAEENPDLLQDAAATPVMSITGGDMDLTISGDATMR
jgi:hypothetical protein